MRTRSPRLLAATAMCLALTAVTAQAKGQGIVDKLKDTAEQAAEEEAMMAVDEAARDAVRCVVNDLECIRSARESGQDVTYVDEEGATFSVGTIVLESDGSRSVFEVTSDAEGAATGFASPHEGAPSGGEPAPVYVSLTGESQANPADRLFLRFVVDRTTGNQHCDPMETRVELVSGGAGSLLEPAELEGACPGVAVDEVAFQPESDMLTVGGRFSAVTESGVAVAGSFQAEVAAFEL